VKELVVRLGAAIVVIGAMTAGVWLAINASDPPASSADASTSASSAANETERDAGVAPRRMSGNAAAAAMQQIGEASQRLLPEGYNGIFIGMSLRDLRQVRRAIQRSNQPRPNGQVWEEDDASGARVVYVLSSNELLEQVQFMSRLDNPDELGPHFSALQQRYGTPTGIWDCPETEEAPTLRRFTWRREGASMMEAVLIYGQTVSITLVVAPTEDIGAALQRSRCAPVQNAQQLAAFPVALELRGERSTFLREVHRDGG
jgi:hypothetical protein